jgi:energy-coupling factor transporter ATP-binding protein EcfA2
VATNEVQNQPLLVDPQAVEAPDFGVEIATWAAGLPEWQQDIVARLAAGGELSSGEVGDVKSRLLATVGFDDGRSVDNALPVTPGAFGAAVGTTTRILALGQLEGVNGLEQKDPQTLEFSSDGLTLVYGDNAAGKTSYARTLKHVGRAVGERIVILPNVKSQAPHPAPTAEITMEVDGTSAVVSAELNRPPPAECAEIQAFDSRCSEIYVADENRVDFTPQVLGIFDRLVAAQISVRNAIQHRIDELTESRPNFDDFESGTVASEAVISLSAATDIEALRVLATMSKEEVAQVEQLRSSLAAVGAALDQQIGAAQSAAAQATEMAKTVGEIANIVSDDAIARRGKLRTDAADKLKSAEAAEKAAFGESPRKAEVADAWEVLWSAAHEYFHASEGEAAKFPPDTEAAVCPLCEQVLSPEAQERFKSFARFVADESAASARSARGDQRTAEEILAAQLPAISSEHLESLRAAASEVAVAVESFIESARLRATALRKEDSAAGLEAMPSNPSQLLTAFAASETARASKLSGLKDPEKRAKQEAELKELEDRQRLGAMISDVVQWHSHLPELEALEKAKSALVTAAITRKHGELADRVITNTYLANLRTELKVLGLDYFNVEAVPRGQAGTRVVRISMSDFDPEFDLPDVLSEGEQRGLGLACFLAEVKTLGGKGPIVLDDPVSSFDQSRRERVAKRLHDEALERQVVVFSHDLPFTYYLARVGEDRNREIALRYVRRHEGKPGFVANEGPDELLKPGNLVQKLIEALAKMPDEGQDGRFATAIFVQGWYAGLRKAWERTVEKVLFRDVVTRFDRAVKTRALSGVRVDEAFVIRVTEGMSTCSKYPHDSPIPDGVELPTREEMRADAETLSAFIKDVSEMQKAVAKGTKVGV